MSELGEVRHVLQARSHLGATGEFSFMPWTGSDPLGYPYMGWRIELLTNEEPRYLYLMPNLESERPLIGVYFGTHGDHTKDKLIGELEGQQNE